MTNDRANQLIAILLDEQATVSERDDAAMDLAAFDEAEAVLSQACLDRGLHATVAASCGESLAEIWKRTDRFDAEAVTAFSSPARAEIAAAFNLTGAL